MPDIAGAFDDYLRSLSDDEFENLRARTRTPASPDNPGDPPPTATGQQSAAGLAEAKRRGYIDADGKAVKR